MLAGHGFGDEGREGGDIRMRFEDLANADLHAESLLGRPDRFHEHQGIRPHFQEGGMNIHVLDGHAQQAGR